MALSLGQRSQIDSWVRDRFPTGLHCVQCRGLDWSIRSDLVPVIMYRSDESELLEWFVPTVQFACTDCGHLLHISAAAMGIV